MSSIDLNTLLGDSKSKAAVQPLASAKDNLPSGEVLEINTQEILPSLSKIHMVAAWMVSRDMPLLQISVGTGFDVPRLKNFISYSELFNQQIDYYKANPDSIPNYDPKASANLLLSEALEELVRRIANEPESFSIRELVQMIEMLSSRTDLGLNPKEPAKDTSLTHKEIEAIRNANSTQTALSIPNLQEMLDRKTIDQRPSDSPKIPIEAGDFAQR